MGCLALAAGAILLAAHTARAVAPDDAPIRERNLAAARSGAAERPRSEGDQVLLDGWPLYRTERSQAAFNDAMATLKATDGPAPTGAAFKACPMLECGLSLPLIGHDGWIPAGRIWVSAEAYILVAHSPRPRMGRPWHRRSLGSMRYFVLHEFHSSTRNTDPYDTISSHGRAVFVPFYMSKQAMDAKRRRFVVVVQVAPYDVVSIHASNLGSAGPGIEVAKNVNEPLEPLQGTAGILIATIIRTAAPHIRVVNHRGSEGQPMLAAYERRLAAVRARQTAATLTLPFVPAPLERVAEVKGRLGDLIARRGLSPPIPIAERAVVPRVAALIEPIRPALNAETGVAPEPKLIGPILLARRSDRRAAPRLVGPILPAVRPRS